MSSNISRALALDLEPDYAVIAALASVGLGGAVAFGFAPLTLSMRVGFCAIVVLAALKAIVQQLFGHHRDALRRAVLLTDGSWQLEYAVGRRGTGRLSSASSRVGRWWFLHWKGHGLAGSWAVITPRAIGEGNWRRLTTRLNDHVTVKAGIRGASSQR
jgi:hypothetical protein